MKSNITKVILILLIAAVALLITAFSIGIKNAEPSCWREYIISSGDTVWSIAREEYGDSVDIRRYTDMIISENGIDAGRLHPGDVILIPMEAE